MSTFEQNRVLLYDKTLNVSFIKKKVNDYSVSCTTLSKVFNYFFPIFHKFCWEKKDSTYSPIFCGSTDLLSSGRFKWTELILLYLYSSIHPYTYFRQEVLTTVRHDKFGIAQSEGLATLTSYIYSTLTTVLRNICAHKDSLFTLFGVERWQTYKILTI